MKLFIFILLVCNALNSKAEEIMPLSVTAKISNGKIHFKIINVSKGMVYISNPEKHRFDVSFKGDKLETIGGCGYGPKNAHENPHWKHLIILIKPREDSPSLGSFSFEVTENRNMIKHVKHMTVTLYVADEESFKKEDIASLKRMDFPVQIKKEPVKMNPRANQ